MLCPPPFVSRVLLSWQLVDPYRYESTNRHCLFGERRNGFTDEGQSIYCVD